MNSKVKRLENVIKRLQEIKNSKDIDLLISTKDLKILELILGIKPHSKKNCSKEIKKISGRGLRKKSK